MKQLNVLIKTGSLGYVENEVTATLSYSMCVVATDPAFIDLFGPTTEIITIDTFILTSRATAKDDNNQTITLKHLKGLVLDYLYSGDTLKAGMGSMHLQTVYTLSLDNEAYCEMRRIDKIFKQWTTVPA